MPTCVQCTADAAPGSIRCAPHRDAQRKRDREWRARRRAANRALSLCAECGVPSATYRCPSCCGVDSVDTGDDSDMSRAGVDDGLFSSMSCAHFCTGCRLNRIEELLVGILSAADNERARENSHYRQILERLKTMDNNIDRLRDEFRTNTDAVSVRIDAILAEIQANGDNTASPATLADLQAISDHLRQLGSNPANPVPALAPRRP